MPENPTDLLKQQADLLNRLVAIEENNQKQVQEMLEYHEEHQGALDKISRAANLYFWLTVVSLGLGLGLLFLILNITLILSILRVSPLFR